MSTTPLRSAPPKPTVASAATPAAANPPGAARAFGFLMQREMPLEIKRRAETAR